MATRKRKKTENPTDSAEVTSTSAEVVEVETPALEPEILKTEDGVELTPEHLRGFGGDYLFKGSRHPKANPRQAFNGALIQLMEGDIVFKAAPESEFQFGTIDDGKGVNFTKTRVHARRAGWSVCMFEDWYLSEECADIFRPDSNGRLCLDGEEKDAIVLYARSKERAEASFAYDRRWVTDIGKSFEEKMRESGDKLAHAGFRSQLTDETTDENGGVLHSQISHF